MDTIQRDEFDELPDRDEQALLQKDPEKQHVLTIALLIFSLAFCALVFQTGWKEVSAYEKCGGLTNCPAFASSPPAP
jgi:hypothetical protein